MLLYHIGKSNIFLCDDISKKIRLELFTWCYTFMLMSLRHSYKLPMSTAPSCLLKMLSRQHFWAGALNPIMILFYCDLF